MVNDRLSKKLLAFLYSDCGESCGEIADLLNSNRQTVWLALKKFGIERRSSSGIPFDKIHAIRVLSYHGWSLGAIRRALNLSTRIISKIRNEERGD